MTADLDLRVLLFALAITTLTTLLCGSAPALYAISIEPASALKEQSTLVAGGFGLRKALIVGQFALALILLIGAGLFARTLANLRLQGPGYPTANLLMCRVDPLADGYSYKDAKPLVRRILTAVRELPEVEQAGVAGFQMLTGGGWNNPVTVQARRRIVTEDLAMNAVSPGFFEALGAPVTRGRDFNERDARFGGEERHRSAIVNEEFTKQYLKDDEPLGARLGTGDRPGTIAAAEIVGVVKSFHDFGLRKPEAEVFFALWEGRVGGGTFYVRKRSSSQAAARSIRAAVSRIDPRADGSVFTRHGRPTRSHADQRTDVGDAGRSIRGSGHTSGDDRIVWRTVVFSREAKQGDWHTARARCAEVGGGRLDRTRGGGAGCGRSCDCTSGVMGAGQADRESAVRRAADGCSNCRRRRCGFGAGLSRG